MASGRKREHYALRQGTPFQPTNHWGADPNPRSRSEPATQIRISEFSNSMHQSHTTEIAEIGSALQRIPQRIPQFSDTSTCDLRKPFATEEFV